MVRRPEPRRRSSVDVRNKGMIRSINLKTVQHEKGHLVAVSRSGEIIVVDDYGRERERYKIPYGALINVKEGATVTGGQAVATWDPHTHPVVTEVAGSCKFQDFVDGLTVTDQPDEVTGLSTQRRDRQQAARRQGAAPDHQAGQRQGQGADHPGHRDSGRYTLPAGALISCRTVRVSIGDVIARIPQEASRPVTSPAVCRVSPTVRSPQAEGSAILAEVSGTVSFGKETKGKRRLIITVPGNNQYEELIPK